MDRQQRTEVFLQAAHRFAMVRLRSDVARIGEFRARLQRWRDPSGQTRSDLYWNKWERSLALPIDDVERVICADDEHTTVLRGVSPIGAVIANAKRRDLLGEARRA